MVRKNGVSFKSKKEKSQWVCCSQREVRATSSESGGKISDPIERKTLKRQKTQNTKKKKTTHKQKQKKKS